MDGIEGRLANEVSRSGEFHSLDECLQEAEQCEEVVSRMVHETRYDARISAIRRVETREEETKKKVLLPLWKGRGTLFFKLPAPERPAQQLRSSKLPQNVVICHINPSHSKFIDLFISRTATTWLLDTEASVSSIKKKLIKELNMPIHRGSTSIISGNVLSKGGSVKVTFQLPRESIEHDCIVCDDGLSFPSDGLLGVDFLNKFRPTLDFQKNLLILQGYSLVMSDDHLIPSHRTIDTNSPVVRKVPIDVETRQLFSVGEANV
ncbi:hypothetical protein JTB14_035211 [Gonioctena quinquepunctata]|nr:hypothetical protein JTB14_035211 [Gonioctena quinquepunctata]